MNDAIIQVSEYVIHKLCILGVWRVHDKKELRYFGNASEMLGKGWTREEYREMSVSTFFNSYI